MSLKIKVAQKESGVFIITNIQPQIKKVFDSVKFMPTNIFENMTEANKYLDDFLFLTANDTRTFDSTCF